MIAIPKTGIAVFAATSYQYAFILCAATSHQETGDALAHVTVSFARDTADAIDSAVAHGRTAAFCSIVFMISACRDASFIACTHLDPVAFEDCCHPFIERYTCMPSIRLDHNSSAVSLSISNI